MFVVTPPARKAYLVIRSVIETHPGLEPGSPRPVGWGDACWAIFMGFEHEKIHIETSSVLIREVRKAEGGGDVAGLASVGVGVCGGVHTGMCTPMHKCIVVPCSPKPSSAAGRCRHRTLNSHLLPHPPIPLQLPLTSVRKPEFWPAYHPSANEPSPVIPTEGIDFPPNDERVAVAGETVVLGKPLAYPSFGWDNEYGRKEVQVQPFR